MAWTVPDKGEGDNDIQSILFQEYLDVLLAGINGVDCVLSGGVVTPNTLLTLNGAKAAVLSNGTMFAVAASTTITIGAADATNPRIDLVVITSAGAWAVRAGTAAAAPKPPARTANDVAMAAVYVPALDATIGAGQITDMRVLRAQGGPLVIDKTVTPVVFDTTSAIQTYYTKTIPNGLLLSGKILRLSCGGNFLPNSGTPTLTVTVNYGATTLHASATAGHTSDADRHPWRLTVEIAAQANNDQVMNGTFNTGPLVGWAPPASGTGNLVTAAHIAGAIGGDAAIDSDAANSDLVVRFTMSVSNVLCQMTLSYAFLELL